MLKLSEPKQEWLDVLPGVRILFAPVSRKAWRAAQTAAATIMRAAEPEEDDAPVSDEATEEAGDAISHALLERGIIAWSGVGDDDGEPLPVSPESVAIFLAHPLYFDAADRAYVKPFVARMMEGNVSAGSPNGTSDRAMPAPTIAASPVPGIYSGAEPAPIAGTSSKPKRAKASGKS